MALSDIIDLETAPDADEIDREIAAGGLIPQGRYYAALVRADDKPAGVEMKTELEFEILWGQFKGRKVRRDLFHHSKKSENEQITRNEIIHFAKALKVMVKVQGADGKARYAFAPNMKEFADALQTDCVVEVTHRRFTRSDPTSRMMSEVKMFGIWMTTEKEAADVMKNVNNSSAVGLSAAAVGTGAGGGAAAGGHHANQPTSSAAQPAAERPRFNIDAL